MRVCCGMGRACGSDLVVDGAEDESERSPKFANESEVQLLETSTEV